MEDKNPKEEKKANADAVIQKNLLALENNNSSSELFSKVAEILEQARSNVVQSVNHNTVLANWLIGREIVFELQGGENRAAYGKQIIEELSVLLTKSYGKGFSVATLKNYRQFYQLYCDRLQTISSPAGSELSNKQKSFPLGSQLLSDEKAALDDHSSSPITISSSVPGESDAKIKSSFLPRLSWSHYRALMRVKDDKAREFYEREASDSGWDKRTLERQVQSSYYQRMLSSQNPQEMLAAGRGELMGKQNNIDLLKNPYVLEFLDLPEMPLLQESQLENAIISQLQSFLLELGKGFAFVGRQKRLQFEDKNLYVDLVFYNCILKCYLLIDLKMGEICHADVGQMDGYVRLFDDQYTSTDDNPTIGLILCAEKNEAVAKYSVLNDRKQIFASKYMLYLPSEKELESELIREKLLIENILESENE